MKKNKINSSKKILFNRIKCNRLNIAVWLLGSFFIVFFGETLQRGSISKTFEFITTRNIVFFSNYVIILAITSLGFLFKRVKLSYIVISMLLLAFYIINFFVEKVRGTPIMWADVYSMKDGLSMIGEYINKNTIIISIIGIISILFLLIFIGKKEKVYYSRKKSFVRGILFVIPSFILACGVLYYTDDIVGRFYRYRWDMPSTYENNGYLFSFIDSAAGFKVEKPDKYTKDMVQEIKDTLDSNNEIVEAFSNEDTISEDSSVIEPNIIVVQLESFFDMSLIDGIELLEDPIPNFRRLYNSGSSGLAKVPTFGGGTVRSEFEMLTGLSMEFLPVGEIPNNNVLKRMPVESLAYVLKDNGYETSAIHNHTGNFYNRDLIYKNLGFENYVSKEYMTEFKNDTTYAPDILNLDSIEALLESDMPQFIYNVTVESHSPYSKDFIRESPIVSGDFSEETLNQLEHYASKVEEVDKYIGALIDYVDSLDEPTIVLMFSDHLPQLEALSEEDEDFSGDNKYYTQYFMWDNMGLEIAKEDLNAYQLGSSMLSKANMESYGTITAFHEEYKDYQDYETKFENLQYDILFGEKYIYGGKNPYSTINTKMGISDIIINSATIEDNKLIIQGENFTRFSQVFINNKRVDTLFINNNELVVENINSNISEVKVGQIGLYNKALGYSSVYKIEGN
ncbi:MAG: LTA synthase family protein [Clostridium perfringens]|nr:LTA synthase family protein [Clostridium perfringens]